MCFSIPFHPFISPSNTSFGGCLCRSPPSRIPLQAPLFPFVLSPLQSLLHICIPLSPFTFNVFFIFCLCFFFHPCVKRVPGRAGRSPRLLLPRRAPCIVEMTPELLGCDLRLSPLSQLQPYLCTQPGFFSSLNIGSRKGRLQREHGRDWGNAGVGVQKQNKTKGMQFYQRSKKKKEKGH